MGFLSSALGMDNKYQATPVQTPTTAAQAQEQYKNAQSGLAQQQAFINALQGQNGIQNQSNVFNQLQGVANGTGPNPAQAMLAQSTGQNVANQAALMAGQRGSGANVGLMARQAAQQGAATQQQAAGQGATMQANQSLGALGQLSGIAGQQVGQQANAITGYNQAAQGEQQNILNAIQGQNAAQNQASGINAGVAAGNQHMAGQIFGAAAGAASAGLMPATTPTKPPVPAGAEGGILTQGGFVKPYAQGGPVSFVGRHLKGLPHPMAEGGQTPIDGEQLAAQGMKVPGKAEVKGNSLKNDKVKALLSPGEVVIPRSVMNGKNPAEGAAKFVAAVLAKQNLKKKK